MRENSAADSRLPRDCPRRGPLRRLAEPLEARRERGPPVCDLVPDSVHPRGRATAEPSTSPDRALGLEAPRVIRFHRSRTGPDRLLLRPRTDDRVELRLAVEQ